MVTEVFCFQYARRIGLVLDNCFPIALLATKSVWATIDDHLPC